MAGFKSSIDIVWGLLDHCLASLCLLVFIFKRSFALWWSHKALKACVVLRAPSEALPLPVSVPLSEENAWPHLGHPEPVTMTRGWSHHSHMPVPQLDGSAWMMEGPQNIGEGTDIREGFTMMLVSELRI